MKYRDSDVTCVVDKGVYCLKGVFADLFEVEEKCVYGLILSPNGIQVLLRNSEDLGASIVCNDYSYSTKKRPWEIVLVKWVNEEEFDFLGDVEGHCTKQDIKSFLVNNNF